VGATTLGHRIQKHLDDHPKKGRLFCGFLDDTNSTASGIVGRTSELAEVARTKFADEVVIATPHNQELTLSILDQARKLRLDVKIAADLYGCEALGMASFGSIPLISLHEEQLPVTALRCKRLLDLVFSVGALLFTAPLLILIATLIKWDSPGPIFYIGLRAGRKGRPFRCYKFRTMVVEADHLKEKLRFQNQRSGPFFKIKKDPRISRLGKFLRRYSLDEIPQLWNVLKGDMSMVGPRPHPLDDVSGYSIEHLPRLDVIPGLTGLWQVTARADPSFETSMELDVQYIQSWSLGMDFKILLKTAGAVLRGSGA
jgi:exopolysaccharide biosynthesis polyprenyl glycosylphosphotransferase